MARLIGVGVGPGDPELVTVKGVRALQEADLVLVPVTDAGDVGRAETVVVAYVDEDRIRRVRFAIHGEDARRTAWDTAGAAVVDAFAGGAESVAFATIGDPNVYSTFAYLAATVRELLPSVVIDTVPGITALQDLASRSGTVLVEGTESLVLLPFTAGPAKLRAALAEHDTVVLYKGGRQYDEVRTLVSEAGRLNEAVYGEHLGLDDERICAAADVTPPTTYLATLIVSPIRTERGSKL
ncbi:MAG: precorrin-2/cobalt-factor-2 C20-methyltransferase [Frankiaceae bacterium]|nr:precorrin-2/cobalt-factor-2 C20-methyltransferase [Frankiaceae bacterium]